MYPIVIIHHCNTLPIDTPEHTSARMISQIHEQESRITQKHP